MVFISFMASRTILDVIGIILVKYYLKRMKMDPFQGQFDVFLNIFRVQGVQKDSINEHLCEDQVKNPKTKNPPWWGSEVSLLIPVGSLPIGVSLLIPIDPCWEPSY